MGYKELLFVSFLVGAVSAQNYKVCVLDASSCQSIGKDDSRVECLRVESRVDCALKLAANEADLGYFTEEETLLLGQQQANDHRVIATIRDASKLDPVAFEAVAIVPVAHTNGLEGLRGAAYCHPGLGHPEFTWSPRVLKTLETVVARTDRCPDVDTVNKTAEELEVDTLNQFFSAACRPGTWSANSSVDVDLKSRYPNLCSLCGPSSSCARYTIDMGVSVSGARNDNPHIQSLECLRINSANTSRSAVAYVAWQHAREFFFNRNTQETTSFAVLCPNGTTIPLTNDLIINSTAPCAFVRQPWATIVAAPAVASDLLTGLRTWWPNGTDPGGNTWQSILFNAVAGGANARVVYQEAPISPLNYTESIRPITSVDSTSSCLPARRWCVISPAELAKCNWVRTASFILGLQPPISCQLRNNVLECLDDIRSDKADFISAGTNYGYLARRHYGLRPVKLVQNSQSAAARVGAFIKESAAASDITRFENLRGKKACFPEFGGLAYVSFVRAGRERGVLPSNECDYARVVGEFFDGACAPGAVDAAHALTDESTFNSEVLCSTCQSRFTIVGNYSESTNNSTCAWDYSNRYFGNNGSLACLADPGNDVAFLNTRNISRYLTSLNLQPNQFRALCRNNSLAVNPGVTVDDNCLLALVVDAEVLTRRADPLYNSLNVLLDWIDQYFGYNAANARQLINFEIFSPFGGNFDLLFKDSTIDLTEPSLTSTHIPAKNYMELFEHLDACSSAQDLGTYSVVTTLVMAIIVRFLNV